VLTPNAASLNYRILGSWWRELLSIGEHIYLFTPESLELCAREAGLAITAVSSGFDFGPQQWSCRGWRDFLIGGWWLYRRGVKRMSSLMANSRSRDVLYARLVAPARASATLA
jgi:hypothetical protein